MGRKIPGKKHRGVKDPWEQNARRKAELHKKINCPPTNPDEQDLPKSVERIMLLKKAVKEGAFKKKRNKKKKGSMVTERPLPVGMTRPEKPTPVFERQRGESDAQFVHRMEAECQEVLAEAEFEKEFNVSVQRNPRTGQVTDIAEPEKTELDRIMERYAKKDDKQGRKNFKNRKARVDAVGHKSGRPSKKERCRLRKKEKLQKLKQKEVDEFQAFRDDVKFGEVVHAPPVLKAPRKVMATDPRAETVPRPGKKSLLLTPLLSPATTDTSNSNRLRHQQEQQRLKVVEAYRRLKSSSRVH